MENNPLDDYTAIHEVRPYLSPCDRELLMTRQKLESRTLLLRIVTGLLVSTWGGLIIKFIAF